MISWLSKKLFTSTFSALCLGAIFVPMHTAVAETKTRIQAGVLECSGPGGWGAIIGSKKEFDCLFSNTRGEAIGKYKAKVLKIGLDIGYTGKTALQWAVLGPANKVGGSYVPGSLEGDYAGIGADASVGVGLGANALIGGGKDSLALQPLSTQVSTGISIAAGVQTLVLTYTGPAS
jgi:Protein of unknown function (DUF992)